eukprot:20035-Heterococcus_DN1.PRE.1
MRLLAALVQLNLMCSMMCSSRPPMCCDCYTRRRRLHLALQTREVNISETLELLGAFTQTLHCIQ